MSAAAEPLTFAVGEVVDVRGYGRAEVTEPIVTEPGRFQGRVRVRYQRDGATYYARPENLRKTLQVKQRVLLCDTTRNYRTAAASIVNYNDAVLEVGCHEGKCSWLLSRQCHYVVGVDKSEVTVEAARRRYPAVRFEPVDGFDVAALKALSPPDGSGFTVVLVDIGGIAELPTVAKLVGLYYREFPYTTRMVVKSVFFKRMMEDSLAYNPAPGNPWQLLPPGSAANDGGPDNGDEGDDEEQPDPATAAANGGASTSASADTAGGGPAHAQPAPAEAATGSAGQAGGPPRGEAGARDDAGQGGQRGVATDRAEAGVQ